MSRLADGVAERGLRGAVRALEKARRRHSAGRDARSLQALAGSEQRRRAGVKVFLDDLVYSVATDRVKVQRMGRFGRDVASIALMP